MEKSFKDLITKMIRYTSGEVEYQKDDTGSFVRPLKRVSVKYNYLNIGENIELDYFIMSEEKIYTTIHIQNAKDIDDRTILKILRRLSEWILEKASEVGYTKKDIIDVIPPGFIISVGQISFDPGVSGHLNHEPKFGVKLSTVGIFYENTNIDEVSNALKNMRLETLLTFPGAYPQDVLLTPLAVSTLYNLIYKLDKQKGTLNKIRFNLSFILKRGGKGNAKGNTTNIPFKWNYMGPIPHLEFNFSHSQSEYDVTGQKIMGSVNFNDMTGEEGTFVIHVKPEDYNEATQSDQVQFSIKDIVSDYFLKHQIHINISNRKVIVQPDL